MEKNSVSAQSKNDYLVPIIIIGVLFFIFGFVTWLNATLIPFLKTACELTSLESYFVTFAFYISYFVMALPSSFVLKKTGFKNGMALGLLVMAIGSLIFIPAAQTRTYTWFLLGLFVQGTGLALLQTASNPYVTILGPIESAAKRISIMGVANKFAGILSPIILGSIVLEGIGGIEDQLKTITDTAAQETLLNDLAARVILPYIIIAIVLVIMAVAVKYSSLPEVEAKDDDAQDDSTHHKKSIFSYPYFWFGVITLFFYLGAEVIAVDTLINYGLSLGFDISHAKFFSSFTLIAMIVGYFFGIIAIPKYISQQKALKYFAILGIIFSAIAIFTTGYTSVLSIAALGFANSIMWPAIWPLSIGGLGKNTKLGSAFMIMAIAGGATIPLLYGYLSGLPGIGSTLAYSVLIPCYFIVFLFAVWGYKIGRKN